MNPEVFQIIGSIGAALVGGYAGGRNSLNGAKADIANIKADVSTVKDAVQKIQDSVNSLTVQDARIDERLKTLEGKAKETLEEVKSGFE